MFVMASVPFVMHKGNLIISNTTTHPSFPLRNLAVFGGLAMWHYRHLNLNCSSSTGWLKREEGRGRACLMYGSAYRPNLGLSIGGSGKNWQRVTRCRDAQHNVPPAPALRERACTFLPIALAGQFGGLSSTLRRCSPGGLILGRVAVTAAQVSIFSQSPYGAVVVWPGGVELKCHFPPGTSSGSRGRRGEVHLVPILHLVCGQSVAAVALGALCSRAMADAVICPSSVTKMQL